MKTLQQKNKTTIQSHVTIVLSVMLFRDIKLACYFIILDYYIVRL